MIPDQTASHPPDSGPVRSRTSAGSGWQPVLLIALLAACLFVLRTASPANLRGQDQERPAAYVLDAVNNDNWLCQRDLTGDITSKPPFYTWCCALVTVLCGRINMVALYLPGALGWFGMAWLVFKYGSAHWGRRAAFLGVLSLLLTSASLKGMGLARTDSVFAFTVTLAALLAYRSWIRGRGWTWFWLAAAAATLTKGPLGVMLAAGGLLACLWERKSGERLPLKGSHLAGIALYFLLTVGWLLLAWWQYGQPVFDKLIGKELVGHAVTSGKSNLPGVLFWQPPLYYLSRAAPWSLLAYYGLWRLVKHPAAAAGERRFERFVFCWFAAGLCLFSLAPHQRGDLLWPILPAGALIAGRELARLTRSWSDARMASLAAAIVLPAIAGFSFYYFARRPHERTVRETMALKQLAADIERLGGREFPLTHVDDPLTLQFYLNTLRPPVSPERAAQLLRGAEPACVAVNDWDKLLGVRRPEDPPWFILLPASGQAGDCPTRLVANRPKIPASATNAFCYGELFIRAHGVRLRRATEKEFRFEATGDPGDILVANESTETRPIRVCVIERGRPIVQKKVLGTGESWTVPVNAAARSAN